MKTLILLTIVAGICRSEVVNNNHQSIKITPTKDNRRSSALQQLKLRKGIKRTDSYSLVSANVEKPQTNTAESLQQKLAAPATILGGALAHLALGTFYCWGNFLSYAPSYLKFYDGIDKKGVQPDALIILPLTLLSMCFTMPFGPALVNIFGSSKTLLLGSWIMALGVFLASYARNLYTFIAFYSLMFGAGVGLAYTSPMVAGWKWLPNQKGLVSGVILTGFGAGGFFFNLIGTKFVNPNALDVVNGKFPQEVYDAFPSMLRKLSAIYAVLTLVGSLLVSEPKPLVTTENGKSSSSTTTTTTTTAPVSAGLTVSEAVKTRQFWLVWLMIVSSASAGLNVASVYKQFASGAPALSGDGYQALVGGIGALFNGFGRLFWGSLSDKIGFKASFVSLTLMQSVLHLLYPYSSSSKFSFLSVTAMCFFCMAGNFALMPPAVQRIFGPKNGAAIYGVIYSAFAVASIGGLILSKALTATMGWNGIFKVLASFSIIASILTLNLKPIKELPSSSV